MKRFILRNETGKALVNLSILTLNLMSGQLAQEKAKTSNNAQKFLHSLGESEELDISHVNPWDCAKMAISIIDNSTKIKHIITNGLNLGMSRELRELDSLEELTLFKSNGWTSKERAEIIPLTNIISENNQIFKDNVVKELCIHIAPSGDNFPKPLAKIVQEYLCSIKFSFCESDISIKENYGDQDHYEITTVGESDNSL